MLHKKKGAYKIICASNLLQKAFSSSVILHIFFKWALCAFSSLDMGQSINISKPFGSPYLEMPPHSQVLLFFLLLWAHLRAAVLMLSFPGTWLFRAGACSLFLACTVHL